MQKPGWRQRDDAPETLLGINITGHEDLFTVKGSNRRRSNGNKRITNKHRLQLSCIPAAGHGSRHKRQPSDRSSSVPARCVSRSPHCTCKQGTQHQSATVSAQDYIPTYFFWQPDDRSINAPPMTRSEAIPGTTFLPKCVAPEALQLLSPGHGERRAEQLRSPLAGASTRTLPPRPGSAAAGGVGLQYAPLRPAISSVARSLIRAAL